MPNSVKKQCSDFLTLKISIIKKKSLFKSVNVILKLFINMIKIIIFFFFQKFTSLFFRLQSCVTALRQFFYKKLFSRSAQKKFFNGSAELVRTLRLPNFLARAKFCKYLIENSKKFIFGTCQIL